MQQETHQHQHQHQHQHLHQQIQLHPINLADLLACVDENHRALDAQLQEIRRNQGEQEAILRTQRNASVTPAESLPEGWMKAVKIAVLDITYGPNNIRYDSFLSRMRNLQEPLKSQIQRLKRGSDAHVSYTCHVFSVKNDGTYLVAGVRLQIP
ncbi:hypothetical protein BCR33DRAFT_728995 [Rhizoclosmatium globosum]|uniref:Uncharacterized protein n=1 Tax=Rhizoclosmatium globosum TaxID=329046 RepID=A0A1Y2AJ53_9FUNG|nr:hypothetical protein BCR33DRAFT_728995 [Rhizoclosmatium globosum]|eukprot:ORY21955.1 hypothetical protein BCR33DRAFT_728995 [Rhizoclosmatium globosum]